MHKKPVRWGNANYKNLFKAGDTSVGFMDFLTVGDDYSIKAAAGNISHQALLFIFTK
jgi:hypothetical protein